jgi:hypothetical protein
MKTKPKPPHGGTRPGAGRPPKAGTPAPSGAFDPRSVLAAIAADPNAPATARVAACRALLAGNSADPAPQPGSPGVPLDALSRRALELLAKRTN